MTTTIPDPTLESLIPRRSPVRNVALLCVGVLVLAGLWFVPDVARPTVVAEWGGSGSNKPIGGGVLTELELAPRSIGAVTLEGVEDAPGARAAQAWVVHGPSETPIDDADTIAGVEAAAAEPGSRYDPLPAQVTDGEQASLLVHWVVDDCADLVEGYRPTLVVSPRFGPRFDVPLPDIAGPEFDAETLAGSVTCS